MKIYEKKEVIEKKNILVGIKCDCCNKIIINNYYEVTTGNNDWGPDSNATREEKDICSNECLDKELESYKNDKSSTKYIEIERTELKKEV